LTCISTRCSSFGTCKYSVQYPTDIVFDTYKQTVIVCAGSVPIIETRLNYTFH